MPRTHPDWMDQDQYTSVQDLHSELQSSYDVALGAGPPDLQWYQQAILSLPHTFSRYSSPNTWASLSSAAQENDFARFTALTNLYCDQSNSNVLPSTFPLLETELRVTSAGADQSGDAFFPTHNVYNPSSTPLLSQSTSVGIVIDATAEVPTAQPRPSFTSERSNESPPNLHGPIQYFEPNTCQECIQSFPSNAELERHAKSLHHAAFECACGKTFARLDNLKRHWNQTPRFPCPHCNHYTGADAFVREDHLTQHLRTWHRINNLGDNENDANSNHGTQFICTWPNCSQQQRSFGIKSQLTNHMRRIHNYAPFPCPVQGCVKVGGKGYFRESDLIKHSKEVHSVED